MQPSNLTYSASQTIAPDFRIERYGAVLLFIVLLEFFTGFHLFPGITGMASVKELGGEKLYGAPSQGSIRSQITLVLFSLAALGPIYYRFGHAKSLIAASFPLLLLAAWCALSTFWAPDIAIAFRRYVRFLLLIVVALGIAVSASSFRILLTTLLIVTGFVMVTDLFSAYLVPGMARNPDGSFLGAWHSHKNESGGIAAYSFIVWVSCARHASRTRSRWMYMIGAGLWLLFLYNTDSKTALAVAILAPIISIIILRITKNYTIKSLIFTFLIFSSGVIFYLLSLYILNITFSDSIEFIIPGGDITFTGRGDIWSFVLLEIANHPLVGHGFASFWGIGDQSPALLRGTGLVTQIGQAHNGYLDLLATVGAVGMILFLFYYFSVVRNVGAAARHKTDEAAYFATLEIIIGFLIATTVYNITESSILSPGSFIWFLFLLSGFVLCRMRLLIQEDRLK